jgi:hypothetical protein
MGGDRSAIGRRTLPTLALPPPACRDRFFLCCFLSSGLLLQFVFGPGSARVSDPAETADRRSPPRSIHSRKTKPTICRWNIHRPRFARPARAMVRSGPMTASASPHATVLTVLNLKGGVGLIRRTQYATIDIIPASSAVVRFNLSDQRTREQADLHRSFVEPVNELRGRYDLIVFDRPPRLSLTSFAALCASDFVIVPLEAADWGVQGIMQVTAAVDYVQGRFNRRLELLGYLVPIGTISCDK